ncbi:DUF3987 domain-containing protein [Actinopolyspora halophila]|uniref:DUF3987 domain-containing protein n=1 Tax=Actinopolyspora halophila TaxID=1850 RepID=UPI00036E345B|nr:DUF3987 domain-containing protein [Actinopolyspora halophila]
MTTPDSATSPPPGSERHLHPVPDTGSPPAEIDAAERDAAAAVAQARRELPERDETMFATYLGSVVREVEAATEADPVALLGSLVAALGVHLGPGPHVRAGDDRHPLLVWPLVIGRTNSGRKGASWSTARRLITTADPEFAATNIRTGLTSGEGLAELFTADESDSPSEGKSASREKSSALPSSDRRLLVYEPEWAAVMARMKREGNSLSATLRAAWEGGDLSTMGVSARVARESHVGILAHITPAEFRAKVSSADMAGGTYNRFLPLLVSRSQFLPMATGTEPDLLDRLANGLAQRVHHGAQLGQLTVTTEAAATWRGLYVEFGTDTGEEGPVEQFISRTAPNCLRVAGIHAALDGSTRISTTHLHAAAALVRYAIASARATFTDTDPTPGRLATWISEAGPQGRTRKEITTDFFGGNRKADDITAYLDQLAEAGRITKHRQQPTGGKGGRTKEIYTATSSS